MSGGQAGAPAACVTCHGLNGEGNGRDAPRLAGQDAGYLQRQLDDFARGRREHAAMASIARQLSEADRAKVTSYYAGLPLPSGQAEASALSAKAHAVASRLYHHGDASRGLPACATCHGEAGQGKGPAKPALAGQPAAYLASQLEAWRKGRRHNDPLDQMLVVSRRLSDPEIHALAGFSSALPGQHPREAREAFRAARHVGSRSDASALLQRAGE